MSDQQAGNQQPDERTAGELPHQRADGLPHLRADGTAYMVDVTGKKPTVREATAVARVDCSQAIMAALQQGTVPKGDVLAVARRWCTRPADAPVTGRVQATTSPGAAPVPGRGAPVPKR